MAEVKSQQVDSNRLTFQFVPERKGFFLWMYITWLLYLVYFVNRFLLQSPYLKYIIAVGLLIAFVLYAIAMKQVDVIIFDKDTDTITIQHQGRIYTQSSSYRIKDEIVSITAPDPGPDNSNEDRKMFYWIEIRLTTGQIIKILPWYSESYGYKRAQNYVNQIQTFLNDIHNE